MKKYLTGIIAVIMALGCTAFLMKKPGTPKYSDPCQDAQKHWYKIKIDCDHQSLNWPGIINEQNYTQITTQTLVDSCGGSSCICAIFACSDPASGYVLPYIRPGSYIYNALDLFYQYHITNGALAYKDQYYEP